jgi:hypothetical protein
MLRRRKIFIRAKLSNPSNPKSKIDYEIPVAKVSIKVYNLLGRVINLVNEVKDAGYYTVGLMVPILHPEYIFTE